MLNIDETLLLNQYGQSLISDEIIKQKFIILNFTDKKNYLIEIIGLIIQSKPNNNDIEDAITKSRLKQTTTPCVILRKGIENHNLQKLIALPENEMEKTLVLLLNLFKVSYERRFTLEKNDSNKWWYWDLSDKSKKDLILKLYKN